MIFFNVVFVLRVNVDLLVINCLYNLFCCIVIVLQYEECCCQYFIWEVKLILVFQDEVFVMVDGNEGFQFLFYYILFKCKLVRDFKEVYDSLCMLGVVWFYINSWLEVSFCLFYKIYYVVFSLIFLEVIEWSLKVICFYYVLLLFSDEKFLLGEFFIDCFFVLVWVIKIIFVVKNLQQLVQDVDLVLLQVFQFVVYLVYWGKVIVIYLLCENNVYMLFFNVSVCLYFLLVEQFFYQFLFYDLLFVFVKFFLLVFLLEFRNFLVFVVQEIQFIQMVVWMLQCWFFIQLYIYVCLMVLFSEEEFCL